jgi:hypothetical protein
MTPLPVALLVVVAASGRAREDAPGAELGLTSLSPSRRLEVYVVRSCSSSTLTTAAAVLSR